MATFGERLRDARRAAKKTQRELAQVLGADESTISHYEADRRRPDIDALPVIADFLGVTTDYLLSARDFANLRIVNKEELGFAPASAINKATKDKIRFFVNEEEIILTESTKKDILKTLEKDGYL